MRLTLTKRTQSSSTEIKRGKLGEKKFLKTKTFTSNLLLTEIDANMWYAARFGTICTI